MTIQKASGSEKAPLSRKGWGRLSFWNSGCIPYFSRLLYSAFVLLIVAHFPPFVNPKWACCEMQQARCKEERKKIQLRNSMGSTGRSSFRTVKWTWSPRAFSIRAVVPTVPMVWPRATSWPALTATSADREL